jgi:signal transduction histidine kinase
MAGEKILIVEDFEVISNYLEVLLKKLAYETLPPITSGEEAIQKVGALEPDLILMDIDLEGDLNGIETAGEIRDRFDIPVLYLTSYSENEIFQKAKITEPYAYLIKPVQERELHANIEMALYRHKLEARLRQALKAEAIATLSGGIAHNFNNMLSIIVGNLELAADQISEIHPAQKNLLQAMKASLRARDVVWQLMTATRQIGKKRRSLDLKSTVIDTLNRFQTSVPTHIELRRNIAMTLPSILGDPDQISQALTHLCSNAVHAMEKHGVLEVTLAELTVKDDETAQYGGMKPGEYVELTVSDTGCGISPEIMERIFDPYFTTKGIGKGEGMGLAIVNGIITGHDGEIIVRGKPGGGTVFAAYFPVIDEKNSKLCSRDRQLKLLD